MVKSLLEGQKVLEKELNELKAKNVKEEMNKSKLIDQSTQQHYEPHTLIPHNKDKSASNVEQNKDVGRKRSNSITANHSLVVDTGSKEKRGRKGSGMQSKRKDFE
jgi:hypothetical protein